VALFDLARMRGPIGVDPTSQRGAEEAVRSGAEQALVLSDERSLGATSIAVECGNRRYRKV
jgi:hypothetical protein